MTISRDQLLPKFDKPPVVEMVLGIEFAELFQLGIPHFGLFWSQIRDEYHQCSANPPLASQIETFGGQGQQEITLNFPLVGPPNVRCWYWNKAQTWLIQVQRDRFIQNWRKTPADNVYPRFSKARQRFELEYKRFQKFIASESIGNLQVRQCEVTYYNHIEPEKSQEALSGLNEIIPCWSGTSSEDFLPPPEVVSINTSYVISENRGRLYLSLQPVFRHSDAKEILQLTVTAKVIPASSELAEALNAFDLGHEWAVKGFTDFTTARMHSIWERRQ
jgi:uncharacterized protein (TIGR04255 family)